MSSLKLNLPITIYSQLPCPIVTLEDGIPHTVLKKLMISLQSSFSLRKNIFLAATRDILKKLNDHCLYVSSCICAGRCEVQYFVSHLVFSETLDTLQEWVTDIFSAIPNK